MLVAGSMQNREGLNAAHGVLSIFVLRSHFCTRTQSTWRVFLTARTFRSIYLTLSNAPNTLCALLLHTLTLSRPPVSQIHKHFYWIIRFRCFFFPCFFDMLLFFGVSLLKKVPDTLELYECFRTCFTLFGIPSIPTDRFSFFFIQLE